MATFLSSPELIVNGVKAPSARVVRRAFYLATQGQPLFVWLHQLAETSQSRHGVVICAPLGHEQIHAHRSLRHLADALAEAGLSVLRLDYDGTGDSAGIDENPGRPEAWLASIRAARAWMQDQRGITHVSLVGLRLGASLAIQASAEQPVENLVLWAPVVQGRAYVRELKALRLTAVV
jgi:alpha/beta superfamily hydrolase